MSDQVIFSAVYGAVLVDERVPCVISQWHAFAKRQEFKAMLELALAYYQAHSTPARPWGWVADTRHMSVIPQDVQHWLTTEWNLQLSQAGLRQMSVVMSENVFGQLAVAHYAQATAAQQPTYALATACFATLEAAKQGARQALED